MTALSATWHDKAADVRGHALPCGHALQEERPEETAEALIEFLGEEPLTQP